MFKRLDPQDIVISTDSVSSTVWSTNAPQLTTFFTSSIQSASNIGQYYLSVYQTASTVSGAAVQFDIAYADKQGSGSTNYNVLVDGRTPSRTIYGQNRNLILGDENSDFTFGTVSSSYFYVISLERARYKQSLLPGSLTLTLSGSLGTIKLTDNSKVSTTVTFNDAGRVFQLVSGSAGTPNTSLDANGYTPASGSYGYFLPDISTLILNGPALDGVAADGGIGLGTSRTSGSTVGSPNLQKLYTAISGGAAYTLNSEEALSSNYVFIRARNAEFNYSENPSYISGSTGELVYSNFINNPQTYVTTVGLYNDNNELLAVAKLSRPLLKDFTKEALIRCKLDF